MQTSRSRAFVLRAATAALGLLGSVFLVPVRADSNCTLIPACDELTNECWVCTSNPISGWQGSDDSSRPIKPEFGRSLGADRGADLWMRIAQQGFPQAPISTPVRTTRIDPDARDRAIDLLLTEEVLRQAEEGHANVNEVMSRWTAAGDAGVSVPRPQGTERDTTAAGAPRSADRVGLLTDPVDPITGELIVEHVDLSLPSFGIPFHLERTYRSRVDYNGPLGPGWDFSYNQRLVEAPTVASTASSPPAGTGHNGIPLADAPPAAVAEDPSNPCGPVLLLTTGRGTTLRFRERSRTDGHITYDSDAPDLTLRGAVDPAGTTWELATRSGDVRHFDRRGHLVAWVDANGIGLQLLWETGTARDWRLARVADSAGRKIDLSYDEHDRLTRVQDAGSQLFASYAYDLNGALQRAVRADGSSETYEYDVQADRTRGDWIPERMLDAACASACALSSTSCDAGGACDAPVAAATGACLDGCPACAAQCTSECSPSCSSACSDGPDGCSAGCDAECNTPTHLADMIDNCNAVYEEMGEASCHACRNQCDALGNDDCRLFLECVEFARDRDNNTPPVSNICVSWDLLTDGPEDLGRVLVGLFAGALDSLECAWDWFHGDDCTWERFHDNLDQICDDDVDSCCTSGEDCADTSCNRGLSCEESCRATFIGLAEAGNCPAPVTPAPCFYDYDLGGVTPSPSDPAYQDLLDCAGTAGQWAVQNGCRATSLTACKSACRGDCMGVCRPACTAECTATCATECHVADCTSYCIGLDLPGQCTDSCTDACVDEMHQRGPVTGPKYGYTADLQFNLVRIHDGNGDLYLENTYGTELTSANFDTVIAQQYGEHHAEMRHVDMTRGDETSGWAAALVDAPGDYDAP